MARNKLLAYLLLYPMSLCYSAGVAVRNWMFNNGILKTNEFDIPVLAVGNIAVGGTGKTPHTEYLIEALRHRFHMAVLSRGYKRATSGYVKADIRSTADDIGDESLQMYRKYGRDITVAVCESRVKGIEQLTADDSKIDMIVLDDAFQHRYVKPTVSVVLTDYNRPAYEDDMLPFGRLREPMAALNRADIVVVTKCPQDLRPGDTRLVKLHLNLYPFQKLYFSTFTYGKPVAVFAGKTAQGLDLGSLTSADGILSVTGIDNPRPFVKHLRSFKAKVKVKRYADHHRFSDYDLEQIEHRFDSLDGRRKFILTTEKDAMRMLSTPDFPERLKAYVYYVPIRVTFFPDEKQPPIETAIMQLIKEKESQRNTNQKQ